MERLVCRSSTGREAEAIICRVRSEFDSTCCRLIPLDSEGMKLCACLQYCRLEVITAGHSLYGEGWAEHSQWGGAESLHMGDR